MKLSVYLKKKKLSQSAFAAVIKVNRAAVSKWVAGDRLPRRKHAQRIKEETKGWVKIGDFY